MKWRRNCFPKKKYNSFWKNCIIKDKFFDKSSYGNTLIFLFLFSQIAKKKIPCFSSIKELLSRENWSDGPEQLFYSLKWHTERGIFRDKGLFSQTDSVLATEVSIENLIFISLALKKYKINLVKEISIDMPDTKNLYIF